MNCYKSSFQECITIIVLKVERTRNQPPYCLLQLQEKMAFHLPRSGCLGTPATIPQSLYGRTDGRTYADVRTKILRINGLSTGYYRDTAAALTRVNTVSRFLFQANETLSSLTFPHFWIANCNDHEDEANKAEVNKQLLNVLYNTFSSYSIANSHLK